MTPLSSSLFFFFFLSLLTHALSLSDRSLGGVFDYFVVFFSSSFLSFRVNAFLRFLCFVLCMCGRPFFFVAEEETRDDGVWV